MKIRKNTGLVRLAAMFFFIAVPCCAPAQQAGQTRFQVNMINSCRPAEGDLAVMDRLLGMMRQRPAFAPDYEISRGHTTLTEAAARATGAGEGSGPVRSDWVRLRRDFAEHAPQQSVQYSITMEEGSAGEVLALHMRPGKGEEGEVLEVLLSNQVKGSAAGLLQLPTPPERIRVERFGKASIVLARCPGVDQALYEPVFRRAAEVFDLYRQALEVQRTVKTELSRLPGGKESKSSAGHH